MFEGMEAKEKERQWLKNQQTGDLDDTRLVDGATGERNVYKRRGVHAMATRTRRTSGNTNKRLCISLCRFCIMSH
jgi:hypothetical protein